MTIISSNSLSSNLSLSYLTSSHVQKPTRTVGTLSKPSPVCVNSVLCIVPAPHVSKIRFHVLPSLFYVPSPPVFTTLFSLFLSLNFFTFSLSSIDPRVRFLFCTYVPITIIFLIINQPIS